MEGVCSGEEVHLRQAQPEALSHTDKIPFGNAGKMSDTKGEDAGVSRCSGRNLEDAKGLKRVLKWVAITLSSPLFSGTLPSFPAPVLEPTSPPCEAAAPSKPPFTSHSLLGAANQERKGSAWHQRGALDGAWMGQGGGSEESHHLCLSRGFGSAGCSLGSRQGRSCAGSPCSVPWGCPGHRHPSTALGQVLGSPWAARLWVEWSCWGQDNGHPQPGSGQEHHLSVPHWSTAVFCVRLGSSCPAASYLV